MHQASEQGGKKVKQKGKKKKRCREPSEDGMPRKVLNRKEKKHLISDLLYPKRKLGKENNQNVKSGSRERKKWGAKHRASLSSFDPGGSEKKTRGGGKGEISLPA